MEAKHIPVEQRYSKLRKIAIDTAQRTIQEAGKEHILFTTINNDALNESKKWEESVKRRVGWNWIEGYSVFKLQYPKRFEIAVWYKQKLAALSMGKPCYHGTSLRLEFVEASPRDLGERPAVFELILLAYGIYARFINATQIRIMNPINHEVREYYESFGYKYVAQHDYLYKDIL